MVQRNVHAVKIRLIVAICVASMNLNVRRAKSVYVRNSVVQREGLCRLVRMRIVNSTNRICRISRPLESQLTT